MKIPKSYSTQLSLTLVVAFVCIALFFFFPSDDSGFANISIAVAFLFAVPYLYSILVMKQRPQSLGLTREPTDSSQLFFWGFLFVVGSIFITALLYFLTPFGEKYFLPTSVEQEFWVLLFYEFVGVLFFVFLYEFFFHGFLQSWFTPYGERIAVALSSVIFITFLILGSGFTWQIIPAALFAPLAGILVFRYKSVFYSTVATFAYLLSIDIFFLIVR